MKYFTPELYMRGNSLDDAIVQGVEEEWEKAIRSYHRRWKRIASAFPDQVRRFKAEHVCLHDAQILSMGQQAEVFLMLMEKEPPSKDIVLLLFTLRGNPEIDKDALPGEQTSNFVTWMYEEFDLDHQKKCRFEVLLSNGWLVKLSFKDFRYWVTKKVLPADNGRPTPESKKTAPQLA